MNRYKLMARGVFDAKDLARKLFGMPTTKREKARKINALRALRREIRGHN